MPGSRKGCCCVVGGDRDCEFSLVLVAAVQRRIDRDLLLSGNANPGLRSCLLAGIMGTSPEDNRLTERKLETAEYYSIEGIRLCGGHNGNSISGAVASMCALDGERDAILRQPTCLWLSVDGPCRVEFVLVNDDGCRCSKDSVLISSKETSRPQSRKSHQ